MLINKRIRDFCEFKNLKQSDLAKKIKSDQQTINNIIKMRYQASINIIKSILEVFPELNPKWLILGEGEMLIENNIIQVSEPPAIYKKYVDQLEGDKIYLKNRVKQLEEENRQLKEMNEKAFEKKG